MTWMIVPAKYQPGEVTLTEEGSRKVAKERARLLGAPDYFIPPHGGRAPSDEAVKAATEKYLKKRK